MASHKNPKHQGQPRNREIGQRINPENTHQLTPLWSFSLLDIEGSWCENDARGIQSDVFLRDVLPKLKHRETMTWAEIFQETHGRQGKSKNHHVNVSDLIKTARDRLTHLKLDDLDELFSLRLQGKHRIWGVKDGRVLRIVWVDEDHVVCPSQRD
jgi:hypothetical protein